jgi:hypothetical protein
MGGQNDDGLFEFDQLSEPESGEVAPDPQNHSDGSVGGESDLLPPVGNDENDTGAFDLDRAAVAAESAGSNAAGNAGSGSGDGSSGSSRSGNDPSDPSDPPDDGGGGVWEFDPVQESQAAFQFAEDRSLAAAETAYDRATHNPLTRLVRKYTSPEVRDRIDEVFSRRMLGSVLVGGAFTEIIKVATDAMLHETAWWEIFVWVAIFITSLFIFVWWERLAHGASEAAAEAAEKASEAASEAAEKASEAASEATASESPGKAASGMAGPGVAPPTGDEGATAATRAGGKRPSAVRSRSRSATHHANTPEREPNKRFEHDDEGAVPYNDVVDEAEAATRDPFEGSGFEDPGEAREFREGTER